MIRIGIVGTGKITEQFLAGLKLATGFEFTAVYSRTKERAEQFGSQHGAKLFFTNLHEMTASNAIDAVYIASPNALHFEHCKICLENKKHVLCEKPLVLNGKEAEELFCLAKQNGVVFMEAMKIMHMPQLQKLEEALGKIGKISLARFDVCQFSSKYPLLIAGKRPNIFLPELAAGALMDIGVYAVYPAIHLFGRPKRISTKAVMVSTGADGMGSSIFEYEGMQAVLTYSKVGQTVAQSEIQGDLGTVFIDQLGTLGGVKVFYHNGETQELVTPVSSEQLMAYEAEDFYRVITHYKENENWYQMLSKLAIDVCTVMKQMREDAGIYFPMEK